MSSSKTGEQMDSNADEFDLWVRAQPVLGKGRRSVEYDSQVIDARRALRGEK